MSHHNSGCKYTNFPIYSPIFFSSFIAFLKKNRENGKEGPEQKRGDRNKLSPLLPRAESGTRTRDLLITNELLYQLSYFGDNRNRI